MKKLIIFGVVALSACMAPSTKNVQQTNTGDWTGIEYIKTTATDANSAGTFYFDCLLSQVALQEIQNQQGLKRFTKPEMIDGAIKSCRPTGRHYAEKILEETANLDRRYYAENIRKFTLPDIESYSRDRLNEIMK
ncbi:hypothetical protein [Halocynthiibacter sp.]|uniref:hypothetical protein n=1 Tax=Halocynthiibacter sp. TaxID=1979210 RepID=UPI003C56EC2C